MIMFNMLKLCMFIQEMKQQNSALSVELKTAKDSAQQSAPVVKETVVAVASQK